MPKDLSSLLETWEGNYKKGLLTFWLLLILFEREAYAFEMSTLVADVSHGTISADENSIYRALNRFEDLNIVASSWRESNIGPRRRYYRLTTKGVEMLRAFIRRNILLFQNAEVSKRIQSVLADVEVSN
jgi:PadR family transcriptional regulator PadR